MSAQARLARSGPTSAGQPQTIETRYDYVIVGGGSAGCVLANRLSADPARRVCLVEAGSHAERLVIKLPAGFAAMLPLPWHNYAYETVPQPGLDGRRGYQPRGKVLGGSSSINAMVYVRGQVEDYEAWAAAGATGWSYADVLPYFIQSEDNARGADDFHGIGGPLHVGDPRSPSPMSHRFIEAVQAGGYPRNDDFNGAWQEGAGMYQLTQKHGERWSAARGFLQPAQARRNLTVLTETQTLRLLMSGDRAAGVEIAQHGHVRRLAADQGVVLCAGVFGTPQLLLLSGIGPADELSRHGISTRIALPGVGENLQDHIDYTLNYRSSSPDVYGLSIGSAWRLLRGIGEYRRERRGPYTTNFVEAAAFLGTNGIGKRPDVQLQFALGLIEDHARKLRLGRGYSCHVCVLRPRSRGRVGLRSADPREVPLIDPRFLSEEDDVQSLLRGFKLTREIMESPSFADVRGKDLYTAGVHADAELIRILRRHSDSNYHPVGTCRMGSDESAVVDPRLKLRGTRNVWIADASVMPALISGNTNATSIMIGERAADFIFADEAMAALPGLPSAQKRPESETPA